MPIIPDTADWTWVLQRSCPECGFDASTVAWEAVPELIDRLATTWRALLSDRELSALSTRPRHDRWSPLEYGCHVRDVFERFHTRVGLMLSQDAPRFANWDQDQTAIEARYEQQDPRQVAVEVHQTGLALAEVFRSVGPDARNRTGHRSDGASFTIESLGRYLVHDPVHHLHDVAEPFEVTP
jgi:hypothetical protein